MALSKKKPYKKVLMQVDNKAAFYKPIAAYSNHESMQKSFIYSKLCSAQDVC